MTGHGAATTYNVRVWKIDKHTGKTLTSYRVRWAVAGQRHNRRFRTAAFAESFRAELITASRTGEAFDVRTGLPLSAARREAVQLTWYDFARTHTKARWPDISPAHRRGIAEAFITVTCALLTRDIPTSDAPHVRSALLNWGFNPRRPGETPPEAQRHLDWVERYSRPLIDLTTPGVARRVLDAISRRLDGTRAAGRTATRKRSILSTALSYAVEHGHLPANPIATTRWNAPRSTSGVDRRSVANPDQARALLAAVEQTPRSGPTLVAFFACLYYAALRPEEAAHLHRHNLDLPQSGWGWLILDQAAPEVDAKWSDTTRRREARELKHRATGDTRRVPTHPELTALLHRHLDRFGTDASGRLFRGEHGDPLASVTYLRLWARARKKAFTPEQAATTLARRPYDLRHAAVSTWLNGGVPPTQVAEWAGHSVAVLLRIYAHCLDGHQGAALQRIEAALTTDTTT